MSAFAEIQFENPVAADSACSPEGTDLLVRSSLYREYLAEREEILRHKWIESEKAGRDIGFDRALIDWLLRHRGNWRRTRRTQRAQISPTPPARRPSLSTS